MHITVFFIDGPTNNISFFQSLSQVLSVLELKINCINKFSFSLLSDLQVLYRLKEKVQVSDRQVKAPPPDLHLSPTVPPDSAQRSKGTKVSTTHHDPTRTCSTHINASLTRPRVVQVVTSGSMVQAELPPAVATPTPQQQPIVACRRLAPPVVPLPRYVTTGGASQHLITLK